MKVGFAGAGNMAGAMARGWASAVDGPEAMLFADAGSGRAVRLAAEVGGTAVGSLAELAEGSDAIVLAVKPAALDAAAAQLREPARPIVSVLGATSLATLRAAFPERPVIRTMPTVAAEIHQAVICHAPLSDADAGVGGELLDLLAGLGRLVELEDELLDVATAVMACTPAYLTLVVEAVADAAVEEGLEPELAHSLVVETTAGTADLLRSRLPADLRAAVASPGGSTEAGLEALGAARVPEGFADAVRASLERMRG
jgi:pyrroline-5-carboxylate reductase